MQEIRRARCYEGVMLPTGEWVIPHTEGPVETHLGFITGCPEPNGLRFTVATTVGGKFKFAGIGQSTPNTYEWVDGRGWETLPQAHGTRGIIYKLNGELEIMRDSGEGTPSTGFEYVDPAGNILFNYQCYVHPTIPEFWEYVQAGPYAIGQGPSGVHIIPPDGRRFTLDAGSNTIVVRGFYQSEMLGVAFRNLTRDEAVVMLIPEGEIGTLPLYVPPPVVVDPPIVVDPPTGGGGGAVGNVTPFNWDTAVIHDTRVDFRRWPETDSIEYIRLTDTEQGMFVDFDEEGKWPMVTPPGWSGGIQYTLGMAQFRNGEWHISPVVEFWKGLDSAGGPMQNVGKNWFYAADRWGPMSQPQVGEDIGFFAVAGDLRGKEVVSVQERTNMVWIKWPSSPQEFRFQDFHPEPGEPGGGEPPSGGGGDTGGGDTGNTGGGDGGNTNPPTVDLSAIQDFIAQILDLKFAQLADKLDANTKVTAEATDLFKKGFTAESPKLPLLGVVKFDIKPKA